MKTSALILLFFTLTGFLKAQNFTFGTIPDTQNLAETDEDAAIITDMAEWYIAMQDSLNIKFVASLGDMTQWGAEDQWKRVRKSYDVFKDAGLPYAPCQGNHDPTLDLMNKYFPISEFEKTESYKGNLNGIHNAYYTFSANEMDFIVVVIQSHDQYIGAYDTLSIDWANKILNQFNDHHAIFITHDFFERKNLIDDIIKKHDNLFLNICGHSCAREQYWTEASPNGRPVHCIMTDYQCDEDKGATVRYYTFNVESKQVEAYTYNVKTKIYETDSNSQFSFAFPEPLLSKPLITDISNYPVFPKSSESCEITATIFDKSDLKETFIKWGANAEALNNKTKLTSINERYVGTIPKNNDNSTIFYQIVAHNSQEEISTSTLHKYEICDDGSCLTCPFKLTEEPFMGNIVSVPGLIEAENYNDGCSEVAYYDTDDSNVGGQYRTDGVDISDCSEGGYNLGWVAPGEWLKYRVEVIEKGSYSFEFRTASHHQNSVIHIEVDGKNISGPIEIAKTGSWQNWTSVNSNKIELNKGVQDVKIVIDEGEFNFNYFNITKF